RQADQRPPRLAPRARPILRARVVERALGGERDDRIHLRVDAIDLGQVRLDDLGHRDLAGTDAPRQLRCRPKAEISAHGYLSEAGFTSARSLAPRSPRVNPGILRGGPPRPDHRPRAGDA